MRIPCLLAASAAFAVAEPPQISGIYPHLAMFNSQRECGTGAVVPFADRLWVVTYGPHEPEGSDDKLYEITPSLEQIIRPESIGGTPANRMIHSESNQLFIGPYAIAADRTVRAIPYKSLYGRPTGTARHLIDPTRKIYTATMEEGIYEVDVETLETTELFRDEHLKEGRFAKLPGYHGKGLYSGQGVLIYANNGERGDEPMHNPAADSGALATWDGRSDDWKVIRRNQFTDVTGPGGISGATAPETDPVWSIGWDHRSLILAVLHKKTWHYYRLPKSSHSYDGAHGWNTEWPRIREIGEGNNLLMTMHGAFWKFPKTFTPANSTGIAPRSNYLKVIGDFARWGERVVFGCDDTAASEFGNKRKAKGEIAAPQSQSNLWFVEPAALDGFGPVIGRGALWQNEPVKAGHATDPYLFSGYDHRALHLSHDSAETVTITLETDARGNGNWTLFTTLEVAPGKARFHPFPEISSGAWIRLRSSSDLKSANAVFHYRNRDPRGTGSSPIFAGLANPGQAATGGLVRARAENKRTLAFAAQNPDGSDIGYYELDGRLKLASVDDPAAHDFQKSRAAIPNPSGILETDEASVLFIEENGSRWRLPKGNSPTVRDDGFATHRIAREVATERDMFHAHGTFYELPARNAGGFAKLRPIATHPHAVHDFCSYRGLLILSGIALDAPRDNPHILRSTDGKTALWAGAVDDLWKLGKPTGIGGPWNRAKVKAGETSDPYLLTGYDQKSLTLTADEDTIITAQIDLTGDANWVTHQSFTVPAGETLVHSFPESFSAYWIRFTASREAIITAMLDYR